MSPVSASSSCPVAPDFALTNRTPYKGNRRSSTSATSMATPNPHPSSSPIEPVSGVASQSGAARAASASPTLSTSSVANSTVNITEIIQVLAGNTLPDLTSYLTMDDPKAYPIENDGAGVVYRGRCNGSEVAIKAYRFFLTSNNSSRTHLQRAARELHDWSRFKHENIVALLGVARFKDQTALVFPWMQEGSIMEYRTKLSPPRLLEMCSQIASGLSFLHDQGLVHGDLRGKRVLVSADGIAKLTGFGSPVLKTLTAKFSNKDNVTMPIHWAAPEILAGKQEASAPADVYALGMTVLEVVTGKVPFADKPIQDLIVDIMIRQVTPDRPAKDFPDVPSFNQLWNTLMRCWDNNPALRPPVKEVHRSIQSTT